MIKYRVYAEDRSHEAVMEGVIPDKSLSLDAALNRVAEYVVREALSWNGGGTYHVHVRKVPNELLDALPSRIVLDVSVESARQRLIERHRSEFK